MQESKEYIQPMVSIIIPCYNDGEYVEQAVKSALSQNYLNKEIIVVDDGSNDKTKAILKSLEPRITKLITQENQGQSSERNVGINEAKGEFILTLDSDDFFDSSFCQKAIDLFKDDSSIKIVSSYVTRFSLHKVIDIFKPSGGNIKDFLKYNGATGSAMFKKTYWEKAGFYDMNMKKGFEDWEFYIRLLKEGGYAKIIEEPLYYYRVKHNSTTTKANKNKYSLLQYIYVKHQDLYKENFELFVCHILKKIEYEEIQKQKLKTKIEYRLGFAFLQPIRKIKSFLNFSKT